MSTITEHSNTTVIRSLYAAIAARDTEELTRLISPDVVVEMPGRSPLAGRYEGRDALFGFFGAMAEASGGTIRQDLREIYVGETSIVALHHGTATREGATLDAEAALVFELSGGLITEVTVHHMRQADWDAFFTV